MKRIFAGLALATALAATAAAGVVWNKYLRTPPVAVDSTLEEKIRNRTALLAVIGMGYVGLPLVRTFIEAGYRAVGFDVDAEKISQLRQGHSYIKHIASRWIADCVADGKLRPTTDPLALHDADAILICVPTPL